MKMNFEVSNGRKIKVSQAKTDYPLYVTTFDGRGVAENIYTISACDFVTMLNWYRYQKDNGNKRLDF